ncbi:hyaluronidase [Niveispirillum lacus]|uniref:Hyaluronidase n=1 Tax=Niveispirillum lacus TaxID=1981099 RepID=A0A255ZB16_9PROT|nr:beta-N-acetylglucosaminidase domain-containing protein [Niveispirillum lacus]OYQ37800.1 hyaluronidase [Niveispirillum lacus]
MQLGTIEGYFGSPWTWQQRTETMRFLAPHGYGFHIYAPKADTYLRREWRTPHPEATMAELARFGAGCRAAGVRFGVGLSPYEAYKDFDTGMADDLGAKLRFLDALGIDDLAILFDDMDGNLPDLAERQARIINAAAERTGASRIIVCPTYYSDDPVLDKVFGARPPDYLASLGRLLDPAIDIFWTGEEVCSREFSPHHLDKIADLLRRRPLLWDNYPVNDGQRMSQHLHLRAFTGRHGDLLKDRITGHAVNPALQPVLTRIPMLTLPESYRQGRDYCYGVSFRAAATQVLGAELAALVTLDLLTLQEFPRDLLGSRQQALLDRYGAHPHPGAIEIVQWLRGDYRMDDSVVQTQ